ncbi:MAG: MarR family transcriptional regulator [Geothrix sp.]|uniref:MarR family winged helix-turn-helix transcriptional regulator n=1 Tax=Geothrix sp. TaxID=1962974 RepID=UPI00180ABA5E|nr:MarR family transcriptional regulator [Geothrix sp.]NWJ42190.1 MarR family transcriptional regulator [Geothrix sp.]WIL19847.1 MAG: MarR family transcriptional regulator [Geothrix sp.]
MTTRPDRHAPLYTPENYLPEESVGRLIADVSGRLLAAFDEEMTGMGITGAQWVILMRIAGGCGSTAAELCRFSRYDTGSMTRMLDRLEEKGLIRRIRSSQDRRVAHLELTQEGRELYPLLPPVAIKVLNAHLKGFTGEELELFKGFLKRMRANSEEIARASATPGLP